MPDFDNKNSLIYFDWRVEIHLCNVTNKFHISIRKNNLIYEKSYCN